MPDLPQPISSPSPPPQPSAGLSDQDVRHVARLARLAIPEPMVHTYALQLQGILEYVTKIAQVDIEGIAPTAHAIKMQNVFREDVVGPMLSLEQVLGNAPDTDPPFFKVPKVIGAEEDSAG